MEAKEGEVLGREQVFVRYQKMGWLTKIVAAPFFLLALGIFFVLITLVGFFMLFSILRGARLRRH